MMHQVLYNVHVTLFIGPGQLHNIINPRRACAARVTVLGLSVTTFSAATRNETAKKRYQRVQCHTGFILKMAILIKMLRSKVMA